MTDDAVRVAFVCVQNAGRSQMATAFAERERAARNLEDRVEVLTGGTDPADSVHDVVVEAMAEAGVDITDRVPRSISTTDLEACDIVATMGCSTLELGVDGTTVDVRDWALDDPHGQAIETVRAIRAEVRERVADVFDDIEEEVSADV
ncbi:arsenate-mycothiol transferase ArsC [Halorientalis litorea]|jgi:protein-tyrosine-phosphatase|uniref:arsenate-mycothiol transferase ArsC n=1 Tax=Halorientalis litorea TaxID=2931977 RepID=UPI001FF6CD33|nr:low molecular weight phosphatase family protein [Halorientalis litorea]